MTALSSTALSSMEAIGRKVTSPTKMPLTGRTVTPASRTHSLINRQPPSSAATTGGPLWTRIDEADAREMEDALITACEIKLAALTKQRNLPIAVTVAVPGQRDASAVGVSGGSSDVSRSLVSVSSSTAPLMSLVSSPYELLTKSSRVGSRYQAEIPAMLAPHQRCADTNRFPEHSKPRFTPDYWNDAGDQKMGAQSLTREAEYAVRHFTGTPAFPAFEFIASRLCSPVALRFRAESFHRRQKLAESRLGSVRVGGRGRRSTRINPTLLNNNAKTNGTAVSQSPRVEAGNRLPVQWERILNTRGVPSSKDGRAKLARLVQSIAKQRSEVLSEANNPTDMKPTIVTATVAKKQKT